MTAGGALTSHLVKGPLRFSPHPFGARLQAGCAPRADSGLTLDQTKLKNIPSMRTYVITCLCMCAISARNCRQYTCKSTATEGAGEDGRKRISPVA